MVIVVDHFLMPYTTPLLGQTLSCGERHGAVDGNALDHSAIMAVRDLPCSTDLVIAVSLPGRVSSRMVLCSMTLAVSELSDFMLPLTLISFSSKRPSEAFGSRFSATGLCSEKGENSVN